MAKKKRTPEQEAARAAAKVPEKRFHISRRMAWARGFWTNYNEVSISVGNPPYRFHRGDVPESAWQLNFRLWPPMLRVFKHNDLIIWLGDWKWKRELRGSSK